MPMEERLELAIDDALSNVDRLGTSLDDKLDAAATNFSVALAAALDVLKTVQPVDITADASAVTTDITAAVASADTSPVITADASAVTTDIDQAVAGTSATFTPEANTDGVATQIDDAVASTSPTVPVNADTSALATEIDDAVNAITPPEVPLEADTSQIDSALGETASRARDLGGAAGEAAGGLGAIGPSAALATGELGSAQEIVSKLTPGMAGAAAATAGLAVAGHDLFDAALQQDTALARLREEFGPLADAIEHVNVGGLNESLDHLAVRTGANVVGLQNFAASFGELGKSSGDSLPHIADVSTQINALAVRASVLNPNLGTADEIVNRLSTSLARGGRTLAVYGIALSTAQINAEALRETGKATAADLSVYDKTVAGATLATQQLGGALGTDINNGAQKAQVQLRQLKAAFEETITSAGRPLVQPTIDAFKDLEPILAQAATLLGITLADALKVVGPLLSVLAGALHAVPTPVLAAFAAFLLFQRVGPIVADAGRAVASFAVGMVRDMSIADVAATAGVGGILAVFAILISQWKAQEAAAKSWADDFTKNVGGVTTDTLPALEKKIASLRATGSSFFNAISLNPFSQDTATKAQDQADALQGLIDKAQEAAHTSLTQAVATDSLSRSLEIDTIRVNTTKDGHVNWLNVLKTLKPVIDSNTNATDSYGNALSNQTSAAKVAADANQDVARAQLLTLVASGQLKQSQLEQITALHQTKDGATDYAAALKEIDPAAAAVAADIATIAGGLDTQATRFKLAKDSAALYKEQFDQLVQPMLDADTAQLNFQKSIDAVGTAFDRNKAKADAYNTSVSQALDPVLSADEAHLKLLDTLQKTNDTLATNKQSTDIKIQAGRDDAQAVIDTAKAYDTYIAALLAQGAPQEQVATARQQEIATLQALGQQLPALKPQIADYVTGIRNAATQEQASSAAVDDHRQKLDNIITAGEKWIETLIATGAPTDAVNAARQQEIDKLNGLKAQYPELSGVIDGYVAKLQSIPPSKDTTVNLLNVIQTEVDLANIHTAINELQDKHIAVTADTVQAQLAADALDRTLADIRKGANFVGGFISAGSQGSRMAGGPIWPGEWTVGEAGPEKLFVTPSGTGFVTPHDASSTPSASSGLSAADLDRLVNTVVAAVQSQRPFQVFTNREDPEVVAAMVSNRLGRNVNV